MMKMGIRIGAVALTSVAGLGIASGVSAAATPPSLQSVQAKAAAAIQLRVNDLNSAIAKVNARHDLGSDASTLASYLNSDIAPLMTLGQTIASDTTLTQASADLKTVYTNYRVLALVLPAAHRAGVADAIDVTAVPQLSALAQKAQAKVTSANQAQIQPLINDLNTQIADATNNTSGIASTVLGYTPADWNANNNLLAPSLASVQAGESAVKQASDDAKQIRALLKSDRSADAASTTTPTTAS